jgi:hypothetical protein
MKSTDVSRRAKLLSRVNDIILIGVAATASILVGFSRLGLVQLSDRNIGIATLIFLITFALSVFIERRTYLNNIQIKLDSIADNYNIGVRYLEDERIVASELTDAIRRANHRIRASGAKSEITNYLKEIERAASERHVSYYRLINGTYIRHTLHLHLVKILKVSNPDIGIAWIARDNLVSMTVTDNECIIILPSPDREKYSGLRLPTETNSSYIEYFMKMFSTKATLLCTEEQIKVLCEKCSPATDRNPAKLKELLEELGAPLNENEAEGEDN